MDQERTVQFEMNNMTYNIIRKDPYGMWFVHPQKGVTPKALSGMYSTPAKAIVGIKNYQNSKKD